MTVEKNQSFSFALDNFKNAGNVVVGEELGNADSGPRGLCVVAAMKKFTQTTEVLWRKRDSMAAV